MAGAAAAWEQPLIEKLNLPDYPAGGSRRTRAPPGASPRSASTGLTDAGEDQRSTPRRLAYAQNVQIRTTSALIGIERMPAHRRISRAIAQTGRHHP